MIAQNCERAGSKQEKSSANRASAALIKAPVRLVRLVRSDKFSYFPTLSAWSLLTVLTEAHAGRLGLPESSVCGCHWLSVKVSKSPRRASTCVRHTTGKKSKNYKINHSLALQRLNLRFLLSYRSYQVERTHRASNGRLRRLAASCTAADRRHCDRCVP